MSRDVFDRETLLDLTVNVIPLGILVFFLGAFTFVDPFGWHGTYSLLQLGIVVIMAVSLSVLTYYSGKLIATDELEREGSERGE